MVDNISLLISHGLLLLAAWRLLARPDLDDERAGTGEKQPWRPTRVTDRNA